MTRSRGTAGSKNGGTVFEHCQQLSTVRAANDREHLVKSAELYQQDLPDQSYACEVAEQTPPPRPEWSAGPSRTLLEWNTDSSDMEWGPGARQHRTELFTVHIWFRWE